jgi:succinyl-diaminopimelate desuccinylase
VSFAGLTLHEVASVTRVEGGIAMNVIPETCTAHVNYRYAPGKTPEQAEARLQEMTSGLGQLSFEGNSGSGEVFLDHPQARKLIDAGSLTVAPKQAWTPVAEFAAAGYPAVNFGPGATSQAHQRGEYVEIASLLSAHRVLEAFGT